MILTQNTDFLKVVSYSDGPYLTQRSWTNINKNLSQKDTLALGNVEIAMLYESISSPKITSDVLGRLCLKPQWCHQFLQNIGSLHYVGYNINFFNRFRYYSWFPCHKHNPCDVQYSGISWIGYRFWKTREILKVYQSIRACIDPPVLPNVNPCL